LPVEVVNAIEDEENAVEAFIPATWIRPTFPSEPTYIKLRPTESCDDICINEEDEIDLNNCPDYCCDEICDIEKYKDHEFCTDTQYCGDPIVEPGECKAKEDALEKYCCFHPDDELCDEDEEDDDDDEIEDKIIDEAEDKSSSRTGNCINKTTEKYQFPVDGFGKTLLNNSACNISCQEELIVNFETKREVKAGMGFTYPVGVNGSRICAAAYKNDSWLELMNDAVKAANSSYADMVKHLNDAKELDDECGIIARGCL